MCIDQNLTAHSRITDHILHFYGAVILVAHVVVDFVRVTWGVSDLFDVRCDGAVKPIILGEVKWK